MNINIWKHVAAQSASSFINFNDKLWYRLLKQPQAKSTLLSVIPNQSIISKYMKYFGQAA